MSLFVTPRRSVCLTRLESSRIYISLFCLYLQKEEESKNKPRVLNAYEERDREITKNLQLAGVSCCCLFTILLFRCSHSVHC